MLLNTGPLAVPSKHGLLTTVAYKLGNEPAVYALEGSIAITGALVQWLRDNLDFFDFSQHVEDYARQVPDSGGIYFVPAFSGLFAPYWQADARGAIVGLTRFINKGHICRAALEATAYQTREVLDAMEQDSGVQLTALKVDGGMVHNDAADAVPGRHPGRAGGAARGGGDHGARRGVCGRAGRGLLVQPGRPAPQLAGRSHLAAGDGRARRGRRCTAGGRRPWGGRCIGWTNDPTRRRGDGATRRTSRLSRPCLRVPVSPCHQEEHNDPGIRRNHHRRRRDGRRDRARPGAARAAGGADRAGRSDRRHVWPLPRPAAFGRTLRRARPRIGARVHRREPHPAPDRAARHRRHRRLLRHHPRRRPGLRGQVAESVPRVRHRGRGDQHRTDAPGGTGAQPGHHPRLPRARMPRPTPSTC